MKEIRPRSPIRAVVRMPGSKSITHRALIAAGLATGKSLIKEFLACDDTLYTVKALRDMGIGISIDGSDASVLGTGGKFDTVHEQKEIFLGNSGTSYRLLLSLAALGGREYLLTCSSRMGQRPIIDLVKALRSLGVETSFTQRDGYPPVSVKGNGIRGGRIKIPGNISSQYISSLLLSGPYAEKEVEIEVTGELVSRPYIDLTLDVMKSFGVQVDHEAYRYFRVGVEEKYRACRFIIDGDVSTASYFWGAAAVTGGSVITENIHPYSTRQGDIALLDILTEMGCHVEKQQDRVIVEGRALSGVEADMAAIPDMVPTLAAVSLFAEGKTVIRNVPHLRYKESDRLRDTAREWRSLGGKVEELEDGLIIHGGEKLTGTEVNPRDDHRLAMSLAIIGLNTEGVRIRDDHCVEKSFPSFWKLWDTL